MTFQYEEVNDIDDVMTDAGYIGEIVYTAEHAMYVEFETAYAGTQPPFDPLFEWVQRSWDDISAGIKEMAREEDQTQEEWQRRVTWIIVKSIAKSGTEGVHFGKRSIEKGKQKAEQIAMKHQGKKRAPKYVAQDLVDLMFAESQDIISEEASDTGALLRSGSFEVREEDPD